jgi:uncharacterized UBP type Zn finger protein
VDVGMISRAFFLTEMGCDVSRLTASVIKFSAKKSLAVDALEGITTAINPERYDRRTSSGQEENCLHQSPSIEPSFETHLMTLSSLE